MDAVVVIIVWSDGLYVCDYSGGFFGGIGIGQQFWIAVGAFCGAAAGGSGLVSTFIGGEHSFDGVYDHGGAAVLGYESGLLQPD